jgi:hypothetical protein
MERLKGSVVFWVLLLVSVAMPLSLSARSKQAYLANISKGGNGIGTSVIFVPAGPPEYNVRTFNLPGQVGTKVSLSAPGWPGQIVLCENGGLAGDCTYDGSGNLDIEGAIVPAMMIPAGVSGGMFFGALRGGTLTVSINDGAAGSGIYFRII